ncbi:MAG: hypothetical protein NT126_08455, partial [Bacteroidetes bacterium]|nr:hypothetical protein [Bacteroidota bacterium]
KITRIVVSILFFITFCTPKGNAQPGIGLPYAFSTAASLTPITTSPAYTAAIVNLDESITTTIKPVVGAGPHANYPGLTYAGVLYPTFCISSNGFIVLSTSAAAGAAAPVGALPTNSLATYSGGVPLIAGLWDNLKGTAAYRWDTLNQTLWIRWSGIKWDTTSAQPPAFAFAVSLNTVTNVIYIDHYTTTYTLIAAQSASIGIAGPCTGDYWSVQGGGAAADSTVD